MNTTLELEKPVYQPPEEAVDLADREFDGKRLILYVGQMAVLDVVNVDEGGNPDVLLLRLESTPNNAMDLLNHPSTYAPSDLARAVFDRAA